ncbi:bystin [Coccinella septempunctata]|uniref:bystin n=1 Tax=Coccinella septempunctata TaxID=41139 RepID=UPI001D080FD9|nr:bystin [Coccinella septempunctata]
MGKTKKLKPSQIASKVSLEKDIEQTKFAQSKNRNKLRKRQDEEEQFVESNLSNKILKMAREQQRELQPETKDEASFKTNLESQESSDSEDDIVYPQENFSIDNIQITEEDEEALKQFMSSDPKKRRTLADIIRDKITEKKTELESHFSDNGVQLLDVDPRLAQLFVGIGEVLKKYRSGKLPKAFKELHNLENWEQLLNLTDPPSWSAAAMFQAIRIFSSNLNESEACRFYSWVLLPRIRDDIAEYKKLNFHLYHALVKALRKPIAFMTGIIVPLLESGDCTLREAIIVGSVIQKYSIPALHSACCTQQIAEMEYTGANSIFLRIFLEKKYSFPYPIIDNVHKHFMRFENDERQMPVLWHQALLTFVQRYKSDITVDQRDELYQLLKKQYHPSISPGIERELHHAKCRSNV